MSLSQMQNSFPYYMKIEINDYNWINYREGWNVYKDIAAEAKRWGLNFKVT